MGIAIEDLINEHRAIMVTLDVLEKMSGLLQSGKDVKYDDVVNIIDFLKIFADKCHHGKEERFLFPALIEAGIPEKNGPVEVMLAEHVMGRKLIEQMQDAVLNNNIDRQDFINSSNDYVNLLRNHIRKENNVLFPIGDTRLSNDKKNELWNNFEKFEEEIIGKGKHEELHKMLESLKLRYLN